MSRVKHRVSNIGALVFEAIPQSGATRQEIASLFPDTVIAKKVGSALSRLCKQGFVENDRGTWKKIPGMRYEAKATSTLSTLHPFDKIIQRMDAIAEQHMALNEELKALKPLLITTKERERFDAAVAFQDRISADIRKLR